MSLCERGKMKAAILYKVGEPLVIEEVTLDPPGKGEVKIKMAACAICHSDIHSLKGEHGNVKLPAVPGHELCGYVEEVGEGVTYVKKGDKVIGSIIPEGCGQCYYCRIGLSSQCTTNTLSLYKEGRFVNKKGERLTQFAGSVVGLTEYATIPEINLVKVPDDLPEDKACLLACGVISGFGAVLYRAKVTVNSSVAVVGCGGVGLNAIQGAKYVGAYPIIGVDVRDNKLENAKIFGATHTVNTKAEKDPIKKIFDITYGRGADYVIVAVMGLDILRQAFLMSARDGTTCIIGHGFGEKMTEWTPLDFMGGKKLTGSAMGAVKLRIDIARLIELYRAGRLKLDELVSGHYPFAKVNEAIASSEQGDVIRNVVMF
ncbi:MAG: alcohol dehydrogenase catalytic domain-containing protein [Dehalococcoidales bacterium]|nr:alcohol dehydrogenase catalytic domain-containing protein [Dehalococcoidales bacterium]